MWVCSWFDGDENEPLMWVQHDLYGQMLADLVGRMLTKSRQKRPGVRRFHAAQ